MRAIVVTRFGGPEVLELQDVPAPEPRSGQVLVDVEFAGVNYRDVYERAGSYGGEAPLVAGAEGAGTVAKVGNDVADVREGDRVAFNAASGTYAEQVAVDAAKTVPVPDGVSTEIAAAVLLQGMTAHYLTRSTYAVQPADEVLVHAAAGGVGLLLTQLVKLAGGRVIATTSTEEKADLARGAGADEAISYEGFPDRVHELTDGGVHVAYDGVGRSTFDGSLASLRPRGMLVLYGAASGQPDPLELMRLDRAGSVFVTRPSLRHYTATRDELLSRARDVFRWVEEGELEVRIGDRYGLEDARRAHEDLAGRRTTGKLLLQV